MRKIRTQVEYYKLKVVKKPNMSPSVVDALFISKTIFCQGFDWILGNEKYIFCSVPQMSAKKKSLDGSRATPAFKTEPFLFAAFCRGTHYRDGHVLSATQTTTGNQTLAN